MTASFLLASALLQLAATAPETLVVKDANRVVRIPLVATRSGPMLHPQTLAPLVNVAVRRVAPGEYFVKVNGVDVHLWPDSRFVALGADWRQLASPPVLEEGRLLVPLQFVSEIVPAAIGNGIIWDDERTELRLFSKVARQPLPAAGTAARANAGSAKQSPPRKSAGATWRVVLDAGHGGPDNGMTGPLAGGSFSIREKDITLLLVKRLGRRLRNLGVEVVYTRTRDTLIALSDRGRIANEASGDLFLSIHVNAAHMGWKAPAAARGYETYFLAEAKTEDARRVEQMENEAARFESTAGAHKGDPLSFIVADMLQNEHLRESSELAELVQRHLGARHPGPDRGVKQAGFRVLVTAFMPSVLIEVGFGTNAAEARYLASSKGQDELASAIASATMEYLGRYERRVIGSGGGRGSD